MTLLLVTLSMLAALDAGAPAPLIPRTLLLGNPDRMSPQLAPDGQRLGWLAPDDAGVVQVWVSSFDGGATTLVSMEPSRGVRGFRFTEDSQGVLYPQDVGGDENFHLVHVDLATGRSRDLTPWPGVRTELLATHPKFPDAVLMTANKRDVKRFDVWRLSLSTADAGLEVKNPGDVAEWLVDPSFVVRAAVASTPEGGTQLRVRATDKAPWRNLITAGLEETIDVHDFTADGKSLLLGTTISGNTMRLVEKGLATGVERILAQHESSDPAAVLINANRHVLQAVAFEVNGRKEWRSLDYTATADLEAIKALAPGDPSVISVDALESKWVVSFTRDTAPTQYWLWDRRAKTGALLFSAQPKLDAAPLASMGFVNIAARDGSTLPAFLTLPVGAEPRALPLVLLVHGGPWWKDSWGFRGEVQLLANRGYAVLQVNFRGSTGYGKRFLNAGNRQWGLAMHDDLVDAVRWAIGQSLVDPKRVAIMGTSYGGYATLAGLAFTPDVFACGVELAGPSNLFTLLAAIPPYWQTFRATLLKRMGDPSEPADKELLTRASPVFAASNIRAPLLIAQGANDPRVKVAEAEQMFTALEDNGLRGTLVVYPDEGHGLVRAENRLDFYARAEAFLATCLGGRAEPPTKAAEGASTPTVRLTAPRPKPARE